MRAESAAHLVDVDGIGVAQKGKFVAFSLKLVQLGQGSGRNFEQQLVPRPVDA